MQEGEKPKEFEDRREPFRSWSNGHWFALSEDVCHGNEECFWIGMIKRTGFSLFVHQPVEAGGKIGAKDFALLFFLKWIHLKSPDLFS